MKIMDRVLDSLGLFEEEEIEDTAEEILPERRELGKTLQGSERLYERDTNSKEEPVRLVSSRKSRRERDKKNLDEVNNDSAKSEVTSPRSIFSSKHVIVTSPKVFENAQEIADHMREGRAVLTNFENTDYEIARRIVDFVSGVAYALNGNIKKVGQGVFLCAPHGVEVTHDMRSDYKGMDTAAWDDRDFEKYFNR